MSVLVAWASVLRVNTFPSVSPDKYTQIAIGEMTQVAPWQ